MKWPYLYLAWLTMLVLGLADNIRGPVFPDLLNEFHLDDATGAWFFALASMFAVVVNLVSRFWYPRWGPLKSARVFQIAMTIGLLLIGYSRSLTMLFFGVTFIGISFGGTGISQNVLVAWGARPERRRRAYSALHATYGLASLCAPLLVTLVVGFKFSWHSAFAAIGWLSVGVNIWAFFVKPYPDDPKAEFVNKGEGSLSRGKVIWIASLISLYVVGELVVGTRLALLARRDWGLDVQTANSLVSLFYILMFAGRGALSIWHVRARTKTLLVGSLILSIIVLSAGIFFHPVLIAMSGLPMSIFFPCAMTFIYEYYPKAAENTVAWTIALNSLFVMVMHLSVGWVSDVASLKTAMWVGPICLSLALAMLVSRRLPQASVIVKPLPGEAI